MSTKKIIAVVLVAVLLLSMFTACKQTGGSSVGAEQQMTEQQTTQTGDDEEKQVVSGKLTLYTSEPEELVSQMIADFNVTYPDVEIEIFRSGTGKVVSKMEAELETGSTEANIIWFADIGYMKNLDDKGMIMHYEPEGSQGISDEYKYNNAMAHEVRLIYNVLAYNTTKIENPPKDWHDVDRKSVV